MNNLEEFRARLKGPIVPVKIPFTEEEEVDYENLGEYVDWLCENGIPVLLLTYGSSDYMTLTDDEIYEVTRVIGKAARGRALFIAGDNFWPITKTVDYIKHAVKCGADAVKCHIHWKYKYSDDGVVEYYRRIAEAVPEVPLLAYTDFQPGISVAAVIRLAEEVPQVIGMKNDSDQYAGQYQYTRKSGEDFQVLSGGTMRSMLYTRPYGGARAYLCPLAPFRPDIALAFYREIDSGKWEAAAEYVTRHEEPLMDLVAPCGCHWQVFLRQVLAITGHFRSPCPRLPFTRLSPEKMKWLKGELGRLELLKPGS